MPAGDNTHTNLRAGASSVTLALRMLSVSTRVLKISETAKAAIKHWARFMPKGMKAKNGAHTANVRALTIMERATIVNCISRIFQTQGLVQGGENDQWRNSVERRR